MSFMDYFINTKTGLLRSGWRALIFVMLFRFLSGFLITSGSYIITLGNSYKMSKSVEMVVYGLFTLILVIPLSIWMVRVFDKMTATSMGFIFCKCQIKNVLLVFIISVVISAIIIYALISAKVLSFIPLSSGSIQGLYFAGIILWLIFVAFIDSIGEEFVLRGYLQQTLARGTGIYISIFITALIFVFLKTSDLLHINLYVAINMILMSVALSLAMFKSASVWVPCGLHAGWDVLQTLVGLKGYETYNIANIYVKIQENPGILYSNVFGIEGSLSGIIGWLIIIPIIWFLPLGKSLSEHWWQFSDNIHSVKMRVWDFCINNRDYFQWKIANNSDESEEEED